MSIRTTARWWLHDHQPASRREVWRNVVGVVFIVVAFLFIGLGISVWLGVQETGVQQSMEQMRGGVK